MTTFYYVLGSEPMSGLSEKYELVDKYCNTSKRTCSEEVCKQIVVDAMGITWGPDPVSWKTCMEEWCAVVKNPQNYFDGENLWTKDPVDDANVQSLDWARRNGLLNYQSFDAAKLLENASFMEDISVIAYLCNTFPITMEAMINCVHQVLEKYCEYYWELQRTTRPRRRLETRINMPDAKWLWNYLTTMLPNSAMTIPTL